MRIALGVEYDGSAYCGWQYQHHSPSVQETVEKALSRVANETVRVNCAGRTDTGVHARQQVIHFDTYASRTPHQWIFGTNTYLPKNISLLWAKQVSDDFHARYSALSRIYRYVILNRSIRPAILAQRVSWDFRPLDVNRMLQAATHLIGEHDFSAYRTVHCQAKSPVRNLYRLDIERNDDLIIIELEANGFLHHMVRNIAGVLMSIGKGDAEIDWSLEVLEGRDRAIGGVTAPASGLYFVTATYPEGFEIPTVSGTAGVW